MSEDKSKYTTTNLYLCAFLEAEGFKHQKITKHPQKTSIWQLVYKRTDELMNIVDEFYENEELQDFIQRHVGFANKIKRKMKQSRGNYE